MTHRYVVTMVGPRGEQRWARPDWRAPVFDVLNFGYHDERGDVTTTTTTKCAGCQRALDPDSYGHCPVCALAGEYAIQTSGEMGRYPVLVSAEVAYRMGQAAKGTTKPLLQVRMPEGQSAHHTRIYRLSRSARALTIPGERIMFDAGWGCCELDPCQTVEVHG